MGLKCGIVGLPNVGKSTLFNALTSAKALAANYPFATIEPNLGVITVPDERLDNLAAFIVPQKIIPTTVEILDIAGLVKGASKNEGLGNQFLANIREVDAIIHVVRCFNDDNVVHVDGNVNPVRDKEIIDLELIFKDVETLDKRMDKLQKGFRAGNSQEDKILYPISQALKAHMEEGKPARSFVYDETSKAFVEDLMLLTGKPILYVCNVDIDSVHTGNEHTARFQESVAAEKAEVIYISAGIEADIAELDSKEDRMVFLEEMGLTEPGVNKLIRSAYTLLNLITYITAGVKEIRAWTVKKGSTAPQAAGVIHTDFEKGFIRAEVIKYDDYMKYKSEPAIKEAGKMGVEGKEYIVKDGDIMHFRFNV